MELTYLPSWPSLDLIGAHLSYTHVTYLAYQGLSYLACHQLDAHLCYFTCVSYFTYLTLNRFTYLALTFLILTCRLIALPGTHDTCFTYLALTLPALFT